MPPVIPASLSFCTDETAKGGAALDACSTGKRARVRLRGRLERLALQWRRDDGQRRTRRFPTRPQKGQWQAAQQECRYLKRRYRAM